MNKKPFKVLYLYLIAGFIIGSLTGALGYFKIIPKEFAEMIPLTAIGLIVLIIDLLFIWAWIYRFLRRYVNRNGISTTGTIKSVREIPHPKELNESLNKSRLTAQHLSCLPFFRHLAQKSLDNRQAACGLFAQPDEKIANAIQAPDLSALP